MKIFKEQAACCLSAVMIRVTKWLPGALLICSFIFAVGRLNMLEVTLRGKGKVEQNTSTPLRGLPNTTPKGVGHEGAKNGMVTHQDCKDGSRQISIKLTGIPSAGLSN